jgi:uncharacterized membrane protein
MQDASQRIDRLERVLADLEARVEVIESPRRIAAGGQPGGSALPTMAPPQPRAPRPTPREETWRGGLQVGREDLEDLVGGRLLAWVGGLAVLLGIVFLFALAVSNGWIGESARVLLGAAGSAGLLALGVWLHERKARTDAALASIATGVSGLFVTITVAAQVYELIPALLGTAFVVGAGAVATTLAARWESRGIAALGILGAVAAPVLAGAPATGGTMLILFVALASAAGVLLWQRWGWLALAAFAVATPQWVGYLVDQEPGPLPVLIAFGLLGVAVAVGHDVRSGAERLRASSAFLLALNAFVVAAAGWVAVATSWDTEAGNLWVAAVALVHLAVGLAGPRVAGVKEDLRLLSLVIGALAANVAFGLIADGLVQSVGWAAAGVGFAALGRRTRASGGQETRLVESGLGGHLALSLVSAVAVSDPYDVMNGYDTLTLEGAAAIGALAAACLVSAWIARERHGWWAIALNSAALVVIAALTALTLDGLSLVLALGAEVVALGAIARRTRDDVAAYGAAGFLVLAATHALVVEAPPVSLITGLADPVAALAALGAVGGCLLLLAAWVPFGDARIAAALRGAAAVSALYLASALVVTPFETDAAIDSALLSAHQQGQMVLSVFWGLVGVATIVVGLRRDLAIVRVAGLALLGMTVAKLFLFDLATLTAGYRVVAFIGLGLLLLGGALVWQRLRPQALADLRETPPGVR